MSKKYNIAVPGGLLDRVLNRVHYEIDIMGVKRRIILFSASSVVLSVIFALTFKSVWGQLDNSGFFYFFSLLFSDFKIVLAYWQSFLLATVQSLPIFSLLLLFSILLALFKSIESLLKNTGRSLGFLRH